MPKQLTISDLNNLAKRILSEIDKRNFATKEDVKKIVDDSLHVRLAEFYYNITLPEMQKMEQRLTKKIDDRSKEFIKKEDLKRLYA